MSGDIAYSKIILVNSKLFLRWIELTFPVFSISMEIKKIINQI